MLYLEFENFNGLESEVTSSEVRIEASYLEIIIVLSNDTMKPTVVVYRPLDENQLSGLLMNSC